MNNISVEIFFDNPELVEGLNKVITRGGTPGR
jgi:hypothetical protein